MSIDVLLSLIGSGGGGISVDGTPLEIGACPHGSIGAPTFTADTHRRAMAFVFVEHGVEESGFDRSMTVLTKIERRLSSVMASRWWLAESSGAMWYGFMFDQRMEKSNGSLGQMVYH